jgi:hypothetical protein
MIYRTFILSILFVALSMATAHAQHRVDIIDPDIKSVQTFANQDVTSFPSIYLNNGEYVTIKFDDLNAKAPRNLTYKIVHCDENWKDEELFQSAYLDGFQEQPLNSYSYSNNTSIKYVHYDVTFPNNDVKPKISGNYMMVIFDSDTQQPLLKVGFLVAEKLATHLATLTIPTNSIAYQTSHQLNLTVQYQLPNVINPSREIKTKVFQNYVLLPDSLQPQPVNLGVNSIVYSRSDKNIYPAGNEFRTLDIRDAHYISTNANSIKQVQGQYYILLQPDKSRSNIPYSQTYDYDGKMIVAGLNLNNPDTDCDYYSVMFSLSSPYLGDKYDVYLEGELTGWGPSNYSKMIYNNTTSCYEVPLLLKQGFYSYQYVVRDQKGNAAMHLSPEGNFSQTENSYQICTYYKGIRDTYTRLIASTSIERRKKIAK